MTHILLLILNTFSKKVLSLSLQTHLPMFEILHIILHKAFRILYFVATITKSDAYKIWKSFVSSKLMEVKTTSEITQNHVPVLLNIKRDKFQVSLFEKNEKQSIWKKAFIHILARTMPKFFLGYLVSFVYYLKLSDHHAPPPQKKKKFQIFVFIYIFANSIDTLLNYRPLNYIVYSFTHLMVLVSFYSLWKYQKSSGFFVFRGYRKRRVAWNGLK